MDTTNPIDTDFITMFKRFLQNQNQFNQYLADMTQQQQATNDHLQTLVTGTSKSIETSESIFDTDTRDQRNASSKELNVHFPVFSRKDGENVLTWLLQVDLLFKAKKVEDEERLQYIITGLKDVGLQWYLNLVQADESNQPFAGWNLFSTSIKAAFQLPHHQQLLRCQLRELKQTSWSKRLKGATKAEINYLALETLDKAVKLATSYDSAMYGTKNNYNYSSK
ncbi:16345_t:CDS:2 [Dentiscutata heterogama]|uniref:16345_t:CDS:1 n=1 Tax=Dentiscutata heterogama TaxID=1316150 RepID=A0ACA9LMI3_9GLOM|nr:16345_t:CDS:2 [Dentiscutata heterogama]